MKLTRWFSTDTPPVRTGFYEFKSGPTGNTWVLLYDNSKWRLMDDSPLSSNDWAICDGDKWRGLAEKP